MDRSSRLHPVRICFLLGTFLILWSISVLSAHAQESRLALGDRLRITTACTPGQPMSENETAVCLHTGKLLALEHDSLALATPEGMHPYAISDLVRAEASRGTRSYRLVGTGAGAAVGTVTTLLALNAGGSTSLCNRSANQDAISRGACVGLAALGGLAGAGLGFVVAGLVTTEQWSDIPIESLRIGVQIRLNE